MSNMDEQFGNKNNEYILFGLAYRGEILLKELNAIGINPVAFVDNYKKEFQGHEVVTPEKAFELYPHAEFIVAIYNDIEPKKQLRELGCKRILSVWDVYQRFGGNNFTAYFNEYNMMRNDVIPEQKDKVTKAQSIWADETSKVEFTSQIAWRLLHVDDVLPPRSKLEDEYFAPDIIKFGEHEVLVDCGAYVGATDREFIKRVNNKFDKLIAIEPSVETIPQFNELLNDERFMLVNAAVSDSIGEVKFDKHEYGFANKITDEGNSTIKTITIDSLNCAPTFIKMDIEGSESKAINGAIDTIRKYHPTLAITLYHKPDDLWNIPLQVREIEPNYKLYLRRYGDGCWDIILYAVWEE